MNNNPVSGDAAVLAKIQNAYNQVTGRTDVVLQPKTKFSRDGEISSFLMMEFIMNIEEDFDIELDFEAIRSVKKVQDLIDLIQQRIKK